MVTRKQTNKKSIGRKGTGCLSVRMYCMFLFSMNFKGDELPSGTHRLNSICHLPSMCPLLSLSVWNLRRSLNVLPCETNTQNAEFELVQQRATSRLCEEMAWVWNCYYSCSLSNSTLSQRYHASLSLSLTLPTPPPITLHKTNCPCPKKGLLLPFPVLIPALFRTERTKQCPCRRRSERNPGAVLSRQ